MPYSVHAHKNIAKQPAKNLDCLCLDPVQKKSIRESLIPLPYIGIAFYKPNYFLPIYYTGSPDNAPYLNHTPNNETLKKIETKYQISLKVPLWKYILGYPTSFYFGYTLLTYWQPYNHKGFIRETDYEPDLFLSNKLNCPLIGNWHINFFNLGYVHQSNGDGNTMERRWDRIYVEAITTIDNWMISLRPWFIIHKTGSNDNIENFLGYARLVFAYKFQEQVFAFEITNLGTSPKRTTGNLTWSFPLTPYVKGYAEVFSGYGQSLIEYNHRTNSVGVGFALSDWI